MLGYWWIKVSYVDLNILRSWFVALIGFASAIGSPVQLKLLTSIGNDTIVIILVEATCIIMSIEFKESIFEWKTSRLIFDYFDA